ncbi:substrate-binding domain-containing protein [uncultured Robinsoniella sp.]|uniref:substrate-binding domain-containing protein n=1 Tax=uncultured Robinsoniella sp. TaxID=904190 RepID=UPI00374E5BFC
MKKRVAALTMVCVLAVTSLAACGTGDSKGTAESKNFAGTEAGTTETVKPDAEKSETGKSEADSNTKAADAVDKAVTEAAGKASGEKYKIVFSSYSQTAQFQVLLAEAMQDYVSEKYADTVEFSVLDGNMDSATQVGQIDNLIAQNVDGILICPMDGDALVPAVEAANEAKVPLITVNAQVNSDEVLAHVGSDDIVAGELEMQYVADQLNGKGNIVILHGPNGISAEVLRREGYENILKKYPDIKILSEPTCNWSREEALSTTENLLQGADEIQAIVAQNDEMAMGALQAVLDNDMGDKIIVTGIDAIDDAKAAIEAGTLAATVFQDAKGQAEAGIDEILDIVKGGEPKDVSIPYVLVTKDNIADYK